MKEDHNKMKRWIALLLAAGMLLSSGCSAGTQVPESAARGAKYTRHHDRTKVEQNLVSEPEPEPEEGKLLWSQEPVLPEEQMPRLHGGLELPVYGATAYASVDLALWGEIEDQAAAAAAVDEWNRKLEEEALKAAAEAAAAAENGEASGENGTAAGNEAFTVPSFSLLLESSAPPAEPGEPAAPQEPPDPEPAPEPAPSPETPSADPGVQPEGAAPPADTAAPETGGTDPGAAPPEDQSEPNPPSAGDPSAILPPESLVPPPEQIVPPEPVTPPSQTQPAAPPEGSAGQEPAENPENPEEEETEAPTLTDNSIAVLPPGTAMTVLREEGEWWQVRCTATYLTEEGEEKRGEVTGWVEHRTCFINLPDVIPSIIYNATNGYSSVFVSCGESLDGVTGKQLYTGKTYNERLQEKEFMMPVLYSMAPRLCAAQQSALKEGNCLVLYEGYRPQETQIKVANALRALMRKNKKVSKAVTTPPWSIPWFIATSVSNHQWGYAVDMSLARVSGAEVRETGGYAYTRITEYEIYDMPTVIHELSPAAATFTTPVGPNSTTAWRYAKLTGSFAACKPALGMQKYCTDASLSPLASEWWHFNDLASRSNVMNNHGVGDFEIIACRSTAP